MTKARKYSVIIGSLVLAWILTLFPLSSSLSPLRPEWVTLILIFWVCRAKEVVGITLAFCMGLMMDVLNGALLGQYALSMALVVYLTQLFSHRMRVFPVWQQSFLVFVLVGIGKLSLLTVQWLMGHPPASLWYWASPVTSMLVWPWVLRCLKFYDRPTLSFKVWQV